MRASPATLSEGERDVLRARALDVPGWYSPWFHLGATSLSGLCLMAVGVSLIHHIKGWELGFGLGLFVLSNATEWRIHRDLLHRRTPLFEVLYDRHTPQHHMVYLCDDMEMRAFRELRLVLIPWFGILGVALGTLPATLGLWLLGQHNLAGVFLITTMGYILSYEWLHLAYHLPAKSLIGRWRLIRWLRQTHAVHHDPRLMQRWNFNVTLPLWDVVRGTYVRNREAALGSRQQRRAA